MSERTDRRRACGLSLGCVLTLACATPGPAAAPPPDGEEPSIAASLAPAPAPPTGDAVKSTAPRPVDVLFRTGGGGITVTLPAPSERLDPREEALYASLRHGEERPEELLEAALRVEGLSDPKELSRYTKLARKLFEELAPSIREERDPFQQARVLLVLMHEKLFKTYVVDQTYVHVTLEKKLFNCVSSAVLYNVFAGWLGLTTGAALQPTHAFSWVKARDRRVEVETTDEAGFDPLLSPEEYKAFLRSRALQPAEREKARFVGNAVLVSRIAMNRLAYEHDGIATEGSPQEERVLRTSLALGRRVLALAPDDRVASRNQAIRFERIAVRLLDAGLRPDEGWELMRIVVKLANGMKEDRERAFQNLRWAAGRRGKRFIEEGDLAAFDRTRAEAEETINCERRPIDCDELRAHLREVFWAGIIAREKANPDEPQWESVEALLTRFPNGANDNAYYYARRELDRRFDPEKPEAAEAFLKAQFQRFGCVGKLATACAEVEARAAYLWFKVDPEKALDFARSGWKHDRALPGLSGNYAALLNNAVLRQVERRECAEVQRLAQEMAAADLMTADVKELSGRCRPRSGP